VWDLLPVLAIMVIFFTIYSPVISVGMISDDFIHTKNILTWDDIWREQGGWTFRYMGNFIFWLDGVIWHGNFAGRHLDSIIIQLVNILIAYGIAKLIFQKKESAVLCAAIYALHFANVNSVAWPCDKWTLSAATFTLLGFWFSLRYFDRYPKIYLFGALFSFILGLMIKESVAMLLPVLLLFQWARGKRFSELWNNNQLRYFYLLLSSILALYLICRFGFAPKVAREGFAPGGVYTISPVKILLGFPFYFTYSFVPFDYFDLFHLDPEAIRIFFKSQLKGPLPYFVFGGFAIGAAVIFIKSIKAIKSFDRNFVFGIGWFLAMVLPFVFWFDIRWLNPATFGVAVVFTSIAQRLKLIECQKLPIARSAGFSIKRVYPVILLLLLLTSLSVSSILKVQQWVKNGDLVKRILRQTGEIIPNVKPYTFIAFLNIPDQINQVQVFRNGIEQALRDEYSDSTINVSYNSQIFESLIAPERFCEYIKKYRGSILAARKNGGEVFLLYFDYTDKSVKPFKCGVL
jgi:hypothetical protein